MGKLSWHYYSILFLLYRCLLTDLLRRCRRQYYGTKSPTMATRWAGSCWWYDAGNRLRFANENHDEKTYVAYFILGFLAVTFLNLPIIAIALGAFAIALIDFFNRTRNNDGETANMPSQTNQQEMNDGI